jgi:hypothetical protein
MARIFREAGLAATAVWTDSAPKRRTTTNVTLFGDSRNGAGCIIRHGMLFSSGHEVGV